MSKVEAGLLTDPPLDAGGAALVLPYRKCGACRGLSEPHHPYHRAVGARRCHRHRRAAGRRSAVCADRSVRHRREQARRVRHHRDGLCGEVAPDGYTLVLVTASTHAMGPSVLRPSHTIRSRTSHRSSRPPRRPRSWSCRTSCRRTTWRNSLRWRSRSPVNSTFASFGIGSSAHLAAELFMQATGTKMVHVTYKGSAPAIVDLMADRVQVFFDSIPSGLPHARAGPLKALAVTGSTPTAAAPDFQRLGRAFPVSSSPFGRGSRLPPARRLR